MLNVRTCINNREVLADAPTLKHTTSLTYNILTARRDPYPRVTGVFINATDTYKYAARRCLIIVIICNIRHVYGFMQIGRRRRERLHLRACTQLCLQC